LKNGFVVQVAARSEFADIAAFRAAILRLPFEARLQPRPSVRMQSLRGSKLEFTYGETPVRDGKMVDYAAWPLFGGPFLEADVDSERLVLKYGRRRRTLDFRTLTAVDSP
jgi:hypothetical protein